MTTNETNNIEDVNTEDVPVEKKLGDLMMRGWTMLAESCSSPSKILFLIIIRLWMPFDEKY